MQSDPSLVSATTARRRRYDRTVKQQIVEQTLVPGASVARIAREHGLNANQLFKWRRQHLATRVTPTASTAAPAAWLPVTVVAETAPAVPPPAGQITIALAGGQVTVSGAVDAATLRLVLASLRR
jgi:transposase